MQIPKDLEAWPPEAEDEFDCLNLNITAPAKNDKKLPVLIWIYGRSECSGSSVSPLTDARRRSGGLVLKSCSTIVW